MNTFCKSERLFHKTLLEELWASPFSFIKYPFRILIKKSSRKGNYPARMAVSVSKKKFKRAVQRNQLKRLTREAYRLHKAGLYEKIGNDTTFDILFIYLDHRIQEYEKIEKAVAAALDKIITHSDVKNAH